MYIVSLVMAALAASFGVFAVVRAKRNDKLSAMSEEELHMESFFDGGARNIYSKELKRRANEAAVSCTPTGELA